MTTKARLQQDNTPSEPLATLSNDAVIQISSQLRRLLADVFTLYLKTKNFHWHMTGSHFRDYHLLLDEQADQVLAMTDEIAERARKIGGATIHSISEIAQNQRLEDSSDAGLAAKDMLAQLSSDNQRLTGYLRSAHQICSEGNDIATTSLIEVWIDQTERRHWFLQETVSEH